jgi:hypothetical protein
MGPFLQQNGRSMPEAKTQRPGRSFNRFHTYRWYEATTGFLTLVLCLIGACSCVPGQQGASFPLGQNSIGRAKVASLKEQGTNLNAKTQTAIQLLFGPDIEPAADHSPYYLTGDFNGDTREDLLVLVRLKSVNSLPKEVRVLNPWGYETKDSPKASTLALAIVHGSAEGWDSPSPLGRFLLVDSEYFSTPTWQESQEAPLSLKKRRRTNSRVRATQPKMAKGDAVSLGTEAGIDITLYWDGKTYRIYQPQEEP